MRLHPTFYVVRLKPYTQHEPPNLDGSQKTTKRRKPASRGQQHGRGASRPAFQVPLGCSTRSERPAPSDSAAAAAAGRTPRSGTVPERLHGRVEHGSRNMTVDKRGKIRTTLASFRQFQNVGGIFNPVQAMNVWGATLLELDPP
ncbi:hypothetical protein PC116_g29053 [Phytophthora cactorum]|uniref:Uncharacterized protein n=1 Tax=Phytophthora cactorum TaxID=29920 RepID=A0A8T1AAH6_9STRA|nr:hypothetical protein Pcac1_g5835 [Phytophthora cactorum]KAG2808085.1 hypothetical protein PC111_g16646 [Phytophthora cactorum]KAG2875059.1 hypothetical protein PC115_g24012 [Phytophthora cactorum]KAG2879659.1 hypothetical protein PC117_g26719 [Phytophthora cactorum]KAG2897949.1 hypothetical protein PC114_g14472 [Phytophthora cactorum]